MNQFIRILAVACGLTLLLTQWLVAQSLNGVYAGLETRLSTSMGGGMDRYDNVIYFRPDGTFTHQLNKPTWKTDVTGRYQISGKKVVLSYTNGTKDNFGIDAKGDLDAGNYYLLRMGGTNSVPPGFYKFTHATSSGGGASPMVFVGSSSETGLNFDGKGNFSRNRSSATMVSGASVGGGSSRKESGTGTYALKDGVLTLTFSDGTAQTHSFFCRPGEKPIMAAVDGDIYFLDENQPSTPRSPASNRPTVTGAPAASSPNAGSPVAGGPTALGLLRKANLAHGGRALDALKTVSVSGTVAGIRATTFVDIPAHKLRVELRVNDKLVSVEQLEGNSGWQWKNGHKVALLPNRINEMNSVFTTGILGLRSANLATLPALKATVMDKGMTSVTYQADGTTFIYILNVDGQVVGEGNNLNQLNTTVVYADFKPVQGVVLPFTENQVAGSQKLSIHYDGYQLNPVFGADVWTVPN